MQQDPCAVLPAELFHKCILLIPNHVRRVTRVSRRWKSVLESSSWLWKELSQIPLEIRSKNLLDEPILYNSWCIDSNLASAASEGRMLSQELIQMTRLFEDPADLIVSCMGCSSQDHQEQGIEQTVDHSQISFWSSIGTLHNMADHYLEYELVRGACLVSQIEIKPFLARYQPGLPIYAPKYVSFHLSWHRDFMKVHFVSKRFPMENVNGYYF